MLRRQLRSACLQIDNDDIFLTITQIKTKSLWLLIRHATPYQSHYKLFSEKNTEWSTYEIYAQDVVMEVALILENATVILNYGLDIFAIIQFAVKDVISHMDIATNLIHAFVSLDGKGTTVLNVLRILTARLITL